MPTALKFKYSANVPRQQGEMGRLKVVQGPDYGAIYVIVGNKASVGRGEDNDAVISDLKASRRHAEFQLTGTGWVVRDIGSANGILVNGKQTRSAPIKLGDSVTLGETTLEFITADAATMMLVAPPRSMTEIQSQQEALARQQKNVKSLGLFGSPAAAGGAPGQGGLLKNKKVLAVLGVAALFLLLGEPEKPKPVLKKKDDKKDARDLASFLPKDDPLSGGRPAQMFFRAGFRELRERNYLRAKTQFETVLQMAPGHVMATKYLDEANKAIEDEVKFHLERGKKSFDAGKLKAARGHFEQVQRLLFRDQSNPGYIEAKDQLQKVIKELQGEGAGSG